MGDRTSWTGNCPKCGAEGTVEFYDAPSCLIYSENCVKCDYTSGLSYYEINNDSIELLTKEEAKERGLI